jgi:hypothetical protein
VVPILEQHIQPLFGVEQLQSAVLAQKQLLLHRNLKC